MVQVSSAQTQKGTFPAALRGLPLRSSFLSLPHAHFILCLLSWSPGTPSAYFFSEKDALHHGFRVEAPIKCLHGRLWVRLSAHVYNDLRDYERFAVAVEAVARAGD